MPGLEIVRHIRTITPKKAYKASTYRTMSSAIHTDMLLINLNNFYLVVYYHDYTGMIIIVTMLTHRSGSMQPSAPLLARFICGHRI